MYYKSGTQSINEITTALKRIPNQNIQINSIVPFENAIWIETADSKIIVITDEIKVYESDPDAWEEAEIDPAEWEAICDEAEKIG